MVFRCICCRMNNKKNINNTWNRYAANRHKQRQPTSSKNLMEYVCKTTWEQQHVKNGTHTCIARERERERELISTPLGRHTMQRYDIFSGPAFVEQVSVIVKGHSKLRLAKEWPVNR